VRRIKRLQRTFAIGMALLAISGSIGSALGEVYPSRPITMIVPYPAGGLFDALARILAEPMRGALAQTVVIENVGGAGGSIAVGRVARAAPDGYTLAIGSADQFVVNAAIYPLPYDVVNDFEPVALLISGPVLIVSKTAVPAKNLKELMAWLKANHAQIAQGHNGSGGVQHLCGIELQRIAGVSWQFVPYRGAAPALQDVVGGRVDVMCPSPASSLAMVQSGLLRAYAVTDGTRLASAPDIPTVDEAGFPQLHLSVWGGLFVPKGTPKSVIAKLNSAATTALADPAARRQLANIGQEVVPREQQTPEALAALQKADIEKWWPIIKAANIKAE
jgi:tripartite-type tricarboxylate transporter receptor subunit TctC